jgi:hypothetical protein
MSLITIDQLLESVDLDFEPRWVTKNYCGEITIFDSRPYIGCEEWCGDDVESRDFGPIKLSEFANKPWQECIYEVPQKTDEYEQDLEKLRPADSDLVYRVKLPQKTAGKITRLTGKGLLLSQNENGKTTIWTETELFNKINELVDAVNKHTDIIQQIGAWGSSKGEFLWCETLTSFEPNGFNKKEE